MPLPMLSDIEKFKKIIGSALVEDIVDITQLVGLDSLCQRLGMVIGQCHERSDIQRRCKLVGIPFQSVELLLQHNGMLADLVCQSELPF